MATIEINEGATIQETTRVVYTVPAGSPVAPFSIPYSYFEESDIVVYIDEVLQVITTDYTITGTAVDDGFSSGQLNLVSPVAGTTLIIQRSIPIERIADFPASGPFPMPQLNTTLDKEFGILQQVRTTIDRALRLADSDDSLYMILPNATDRAGDVVGFDAQGDLLVQPINDFSWISDISSLTELADPASEDWYVIEDGTTGVIHKLAEWQVHSMKRTATSPLASEWVPADGEDFFAGDNTHQGTIEFTTSTGALTKRRHTSLTGTYWYPYERIQDFTVFKNGNGTQDGSGNTTALTEGTGFSEFSYDAADRFTISGINIGTPTAPIVTCGAHTLTVGDYAYLYGIVGTMGDILDNRQFPVSAIGPTTVTLTTPDLSGKTYTSGGTVAVALQRTGLAGKRVFINHWGLGDAACYNGFARVNREVDANSWLQGNAAILFNGDVNGVANGCYLNPYEIALTESNGADITAIGHVMNFYRTTDTSTKIAGSNQSSDYSGKDCVWIGVLPQNPGTAYCDAMYSGSGKWKVGLDFTRTTFDPTHNVAIALKQEDRIYFNAAGITDADKSNVAWYATDNLAAADSRYLHLNGAGNFEFVHSGTALWGLNPTTMTCLVDVNMIGKVLKVSGTQVVGAQGAAVAKPAAGATVDAEARTAIDLIIDRLAAHGLIA